MTNGKIVKNKVVEEEESEWEDLETSHEDEDFMETDDDQDSIEEEKEENNVKEVNQGFICFLPAWVLIPSGQLASCYKQHASTAEPPGITTKPLEPRFL